MTAEPKNRQSGVFQESWRLRMVDYGQVAVNASILTQPSQKGQKILEKSYLGHSPSAFTASPIRNGAAAATAAAVVCVHGLTRNGRDFDRLAAALAKETQVFCPDIVGRGKSDFLKDPALYGYPQYVADMTALIARMDAPNWSIGSAPRWAASSAC